MKEWISSSLKDDTVPRVNDCTVFMQRTPKTYCIMGMGKLRIPGGFGRKTLDSNDQNQIADQWFSLKQWFAGVLSLTGSENLVVVIVI